MADNIKLVKGHWDAQANNESLDVDLVTHRDRFQRKLENDILRQYLPDNMRILDIGCGNGYSTAWMAERAKQVVAVDYSAPMINRANQSFGKTPRLSFQVMDVLDLNFPAESFDVAVTQRCLINLVTWEAQQKAIENIAKILKPGGFFFMQEGSQQGRSALNLMRKSLDLEPMPKVAFNLDFDENLLWPSIKEQFEIVHVHRFGTYDFISRVVHPLLVAPNEPDYLAKINEVAFTVGSRISVAPECSREFTAVLRRK